MDTLLLIIRLLLAAVFVVAGVSKLLDPRGSIAAVQGFGVPDALAKPAGIGLPIAELAIGLALVPLASAQWGGVAASALMLLFIVAIGVTLARGQRPDCHCFGQLHSEPIGWKTLTRNGALAVLGLAVAWRGGGASVVTRFEALSGAGRATVLLAALAVALLAVEGWVIYQLKGQNARLLARVDGVEAVINGAIEESVPGPAVGSVAPGFALHSVGKGLVTIDTLKALGKPILLVFAEPTCSACNTMMPKLGRWNRELADVLTVAVMSTGTVEANQKKVDRHGLSWVLLQDQREIATAYRVPGTPAAVLLEPDGTVAEPMVFGPDPIDGLLRDIAQAVSTPGADVKTHAHPSNSVMAGSGAVARPAL